MANEVKEKFKGKIVFYNCDVPLGQPDKNDDSIADCNGNNCSAFALYSKKNFKQLKLKK